MKLGLFASKHYWQGAFGLFLLSVAFGFLFG